MKKTTKKTPAKATTKGKTTKQPARLASAGQPDSADERNPIEPPPKPDHTLLIPNKLRTMLLELNNREKELNQALSAIRQQRDTAFQAFLLGHGIDDPARINIDQNLKAIIVWEKETDSESPSK